MTDARQMNPIEEERREIGGTLLRASGGRCGHWQRRTEELPSSQCTGPVAFILRREAPRGAIQWCNGHAEEFAPAQWRDLTEPAAIDVARGAAARATGGKKKMTRDQKGDGSPP